MLTDQRFLTLDSGCSGDGETGFYHTDCQVHWVNMWKKRNIYIEGSLRVGQPGTQVIADNPALLAERFMFGERLCGKTRLHTLVPQLSA